MRINMENVYDLHRHTHCFVMYITRKEIVTHIHNTTKRCPVTLRPDIISLDASISYNKKRTDVTGFAWNCKEKDRNNIVIDNFHDGLYKLFKKDKETWNKEDKFFVKAISDYLPLAVKEIIKIYNLRIENFDLFHYAFVVPSEWEEEIRDDMIRPIFVQSGLISKEDHQDRLLFYTDIESLCYYKDSFKRGDNTILCRITPEPEKTIIKFALVQTATTLFSIPNAKLFPKVMNSSSVSVTAGEVEGRIEVFLRANLFPMTTKDNDDIRESQNPKSVLSDQDQIIEAIMEGINSGRFPSLIQYEEEEEEEELWISFNEKWILSESQKEFINSLCPSIICAEIGTFLLDYMKNLVSSNSTKSYRLLLIRDHSDRLLATWENDITWVKYMLQYNSRSLNYVSADLVEVIIADDIMKGAGEAVFEAIQHSDIYCKPRIVPSEDLSFSSSVFLNSKPDAIINLDISLGVTLFTCSILDEDGLIQQIYDHDHFIGDNLPPLGYFYTFSDRTTLNVKEQFIPFAEKYLLGGLSDLIADDDVSIKKDLLLEMKFILTKIQSEGEVLVSTSKKKYITAFMLMYMIYIKEEILCNLTDKLVSDTTNMRIGYAVSIEARLLNNTVESKDNLREIMYESGLVSKNDRSKKLRITTQGERILPAIQKSLELELSLKSYFLLCQLHEDYVQLSLHQVVTYPNPEEKEQESIIVQDEIIPIQNIYDSLCSYMWLNLSQDSSLIELCKMHNTSVNNKIISLFSPKVKTEFFANLKSHISYNVLQNNPDTQSADTVNLTSSCNCKVRLTTSDIIDISFMPVLQDFAHTLSASLLNNELFGNYMGIDYLLSFIRFNNNPQLLHTFAKILEEEANDFNLEMGIDTSCLVVTELFSQHLKPVITQQPLCYKDFKIGALQQVHNENHVFTIYGDSEKDICPVYKSKITDTKTIECSRDIFFPFLNKGEIINNTQLSKMFYLRNKNDCKFNYFYMDLYQFETMSYLEDNETLYFDDNISKYVDGSTMYFREIFEDKDVDIPVMVSIRYVSYTSSFQFSVKIIGSDTRDEDLMKVTELSEPLTLARL